jgi:hypothetical protein
MKTVFDQSTRDELTTRIDALNENNAAQWGKMNAYQMVKHCILADEMYMGKKQYKRVFLGRLIGQMALKNMLKDETPMSRNAPTGDDFKIKETDGDFPSEKAKWVAVIGDYQNYTNPNFIHWFFGNMTTEQVGYFAYKHTDHHLRQFGV